MKSTVSYAAAILALASCASVPNDNAAELPVSPGPSLPVYKIGDLQGASGNALSQLLGEPSLTRREGKGVFQRYSLSRCELIILLYPDETGTERASQIDTTAKIAGEEKPDLADCLAAG